MEQMRCIVIKEPGGPEVLRYEFRPRPSAGPGQVLIKVVSAGVNRPDVAQRKGHYPPPLWAPQDIPGLEVAGIVEAVGPGCGGKGIKQGDAVCALVSGGGYAEYVVAEADHCIPVGDGIDLEASGALPESIFTVYHNVFERGAIKRGETLLVQGGTSGIGVMAIQMARAAGATVLATAGSEMKCRACERLGAHLAVDYKLQSFKDEVLRYTAGRGVDVVLDMIGGPYLNDHLELLREDGRLLLINFMGGNQAQLSLTPILRKRLTISGSTLRSRSNEFKARLTKEIIKVVWPMMVSGKVKPVIDAIYPLSEAASAHRKMELSTHIGKILLVPEK